MPGEKRFRNAVPAYVLLTNNFRDGVLASSVTKYPWLHLITSKCMQIAYKDWLSSNFQLDWNKKRSRRYGPHNCCRNQDEDMEHWILEPLPLLPLIKAEVLSCLFLHQTKKCVLKDNNNKIKHIVSGEVCHFQKYWSNPEEGERRVSCKYCPFSTS
jgi:hypothetical protein